MRFHTLFLTILLLSLSGATGTVLAIEDNSVLDDVLNRYISPDEPGMVT